MMSVASSPPPLNRSSMIDGLLADLREEVAVEVREAAERGVGHVDVGDAAAGQLVDLAAVVFDPGQVPEPRFVRAPARRSPSRAALRRIGAHLSTHLLSGGAFEEAVDVVRRRAGRAR